MRGNQMSDEEREIYTTLLNIAKPDINRHRRKVIIRSIVAFLAVVVIIIWYWNRPTVAYSTSLSLGGQFYALWGALLVVLAALSSPSTLGLMSMTRWDGNSKLFAELMKSQFSALVGISFIICGFIIQALAMLSSGS